MQNDRIDFVTSFIFFQLFFAREDTSFAQLNLYSATKQESVKLQIKI